MLTMISNPQSHTHHLLNRDGTAALCRKNITPYTWTTQYGTHRATYEVHGEALRRSTHTHRVTCLGCQRKLAKLTAEAFDAAAVQDAARTAELDNHVDHRIHNVAEAFAAARSEQAARFAGPGARILVADEGGCLAVSVDSGFGLRLAATVPTGSRAAYPEAVKRGMDEACRKVAGVVAEYRRMYPDALVIGWTPLR